MGKVNGSGAWNREREGERKRARERERERKTERDGEGEMKKWVEGRTRSQTGTMYRN